MFFFIKTKDIADYIGIGSEHLVKCIHGREGKRLTKARMIRLLDFYRNAKNAIDRTILAINSEIEKRK